MYTCPPRVITEETSARFREEADAGDGGRTNTRIVRGKGQRLSSIVRDDRLAVVKH